MGCFHLCCTRQEARSTPIEEDIQSGTKKEKKEKQKLYIWGKRLHCWRNVGIWTLELNKTDLSLKKHLIEFFPYKRTLR